MDVSYDCELNLYTDFEPTSFKEASSHDEWKEAMKKEYDALIKNGISKLVYPPLGTKRIGCKWVYKNKYKVDGSLDNHKARFVAKGFAQKEGVDYEETFSPTTKWATIRTLFALAAQNGNNESYIASIKKELRKGFEMTDLGYAHYYHGIEVTQHPNSIFLSQKKYIGDLLNRFGMAECNPLTTPIEQNLKLTSIEGKEFEDTIKYRQLVGSLNNLTTTRPDISLVAGILSMLMQKPCKGHWSAAKRVLEYLKGTQDFGLKYTQRSRKQLVPVNFTTEAEYVIAAEATKEIVWLRKILEDLQVKQVHSTPLMINNTSAVKLAKNPKLHDRIKNIYTKYHLIRHHVEAKTVHLCHCSTNEQIADIFTKELGREKLGRFRTTLGLNNIPSD
eukprot:PITA_02594